jgi:hypothetical protein
MSYGGRVRAGDDTSSSSSSSSSSRSTNEHDLLEVENLLESYLMMVDGTLAKLAGGCNMCYFVT